MSGTSCTLCRKKKGRFFHKDRFRSYYQCEHCRFIFVSPAEHISLKAEKARYDKHENSSTDIRYQNFLSQILDPLLLKIKCEDHGLDFGSGPEPVLRTMLAEKGYQIAAYDPFYHDDKRLLKHSYDYITCTEVVEHFRRPWLEWQRLVELLRRGGWLAVMTQTVPEESAFDKWHYIRDPTHVGYYSLRTFEWLAETHSLSLQPCSASVFLFQR